MGLFNAESVKRWTKDNGDKTYRLNYNLNSNSVVFDVGGYYGTWSTDIFLKYGCNIHIFEPVQQHINNIYAKFSKNDKIIINPYGLSNRNTCASISQDGVASSFFAKNDANTETAELVDIKQYMKENHINFIDLIKINIEGGEYDLLEYIIASKMTEKFGNIQVQFHNIFDGAEARMKKIQKALSQTHKLTWYYEMCWENWELKDSAQKSKSNFQNLKSLFCKNNDNKR